MCQVVSFALTDILSMVEFSVLAFHSGFQDLWGVVGREGDILKKLCFGMVSRD